MVASAYRWDVSSAGVTFLGAALIVATAYHHIVHEPSTVGQVIAPTAAFLLDGGLAVGVAAAGIAMARSDRGPEHNRTVAAFGAGTGLAFVAAVALTIGIRAAEGRTVPEPEFVLFTAVGAGFLTGALAGEYRARSRSYARSAARKRDSLAFVNGMLRHDVRNDAAVIAGYAEDLDGGEVATGDRTAATVVRDRAQRVVERTKLARAVAETVSGEADPDAIPLAPLVDEAVASARAAYPSATVTNEVPEGLAVPVNEAFRLVLDNLIENAIEHHNGDATVRIDAARNDDRVRIRVLDDGPGIDPETRSGLFDHAAGTAKGLHIVNTVVDGLGGDVRVEDREPEGTAFVITFPAAPDERQDGSETQESPEPYVSGGRQED
ncbi:ATP-binding protein [Halobaculum rubrum]|uniref:ATP-binding protein n=1 Tax=Halobaculum rubrum TaxID=2872158 RepID=UPI001CA41997|nr:ATP-binding protein [Halobaculum rubrum]QZY00622.1 ATP-binding protein [Halobaculum rubrum]